jgi:GTPase
MRLKSRTKRFIKELLIISASIIVATAMTDTVKDERVRQVLTAVVVLGNYLRKSPIETKERNEDAP